MSLLRSIFLPMRLRSAWLTKFSEAPVSMISWTSCLLMRPLMYKGGVPFGAVFLSVAAFKAKLGSAVRASLAVPVFLGSCEGAPLLRELQLSFVCFPSGWIVPHGWHHRSPGLIVSFFGHLVLTWPSWPQR